jgi:hypothetical protein
LAFSCFLGRAQTGDTPTPESSELQNVRTIQLAMFQYENDHGGQYPDGKSSTEVFQKLVDGKYLNVLAVYYLAMPGKIKPRDDATHLLPENVCFDVTTPVTGKSPDHLPTVFATGYRIDYKLGGSAIPLAGHSRPDVCAKGLLVSYHSCQAAYVPSEGPNGVVPNVIPAEGADLGPGPYKQLTPDGPLPPP